METEERSDSEHSIPHSPPSPTPMETHSSSNVMDEEPSNRSKRKEKSKRSKVWDHFTVYVDKNGKKRAKCNYCDRGDYACDTAKNGTSTMNSHMKVCKNHPENIYVNDNHTIQSSFQSVTGELRDLSSGWKFDQEAVRRALIRMIIVDELPFKFVENEGFRFFISVACPQFFIPSRTTIARDCLKLHFDEKDKLKSYFRKFGQRISLTTDTWTSNQRLTYLCLTAHFLDQDWKLRKYILNFIPCPTHKGDEVGLLIEKCLLDWGIDKVFTITVDNASSNDTTVAYLRRRFVSWGTAVLNGKFLHMRCVAHIVNLIVRDGLRDVNESVERVRTVVKYVKQSPARLRKFNDFVVEEKIESKKSLSLDVPTRWNSVFTMLETALIFQGVFDRYETYDSDFRSDFLPGGPYARLGLPTKYDWVVVSRLVKVLQHFYDLTVRVSGSSYVTSNTFLDEISDVDFLLKEWLDGDDDDLVDMARQMKLKFDKYWGDMEKMNMFLYVAVILDPRHKLNYIQYVFKNMYGDEIGEKMGNLAKNALYETFEEYKTSYASILESSQRSSTSSVESSPSSDSSKSDGGENERRVIRAHKKKFQQMISESGGTDESEVDMYLHERIEKDHDDFDIIDWWKVHSPRFPILSRLTRDLLAMPISTVASESCFSTGGRIIDDFRASLTPKSAQALICTQDWLRQSPIRSLEEDFEFMLRIEKDVAPRSGAESNILGL